LIADDGVRLDPFFSASIENIRREINSRAPCP